MRIALLSDIHGNLPALEAVLADAARRGAEALCCLGDIAHKGPQPAECLDRVRELGIPTIYGNTEQWLLQQPAEVLENPRHREVLPWCRAQLGADRLAWMAALPFSLTLSAGDHRLLLVHGSPRSENEFLYPWLAEDELAGPLAGVTADVVAFGHHHLPMVRRSHGRLVLNGGSVGLPFDGDPRAAYALVTSSGPDLAVELVRVPYDTGAVQQAARARGLGDLDWYLATVATGRPGGT